jgi:hypothetical protein
MKYRIHIFDEILKRKQATALAIMFNPKIQLAENF